jgi:glycine cleavage system H lipoate-binding protein
VGRILTGFLYRKRSAATINKDDIMEYFTYADVSLTNRIEYLMAMGVKVYYHRGHSWVIPEGGDAVRVGIDDFSQKLVGKIDAIKCPPVGSRVTQGEKTWTLFVNSKSIDMVSPVDGEIIDVNERLLSSPDSIVKDPYGQSWLMKVQVPQLSANLKNLLFGGAARKWMEEVSENLRSRTEYAIGPVCQDGGVLVEGIARNLDRDRWDEIAREYFLTS